MSREEIKTLLAPGDLRTAGRSGEVAAAIAAGGAVIDDVLRVAEEGPRPVTMRALDALEKATAHNGRLPAGAGERLLALAERLTDKEARWHLAQLLPRCQLTARHRRRAVAALRVYLHDRSSIVRTFAMDALALLAGSDASVRAAIAEALTTGTPAMKARARKLALI